MIADKCCMTRDSAVRNGCDSVSSGLLWGAMQRQSSPAHTKRAMEAYRSIRLSSKTLRGMVLQIQNSSLYLSMSNVAHSDIEVVKVAMPNAHIRSFPRLPSIDNGPMPHRETILLVDDHPSIRKLLGSILKSEGYAVLEAEDGRQALEQCRCYENPIHLLLTDIVMPGMNGPMLAEQVTMLRPGIRILYMSGYIDPLAFTRLQPPGDDHFLRKPCDIREVSSKVRSLLDHA